MSGDDSKTNANWASSFFGAKLLTKNGEAKSDDVVSGKDIVGIYFSAHWCPPCRGFTPKLAEIYKKITGDGKKFEIVFASSDRDDKSFTDYYAEMPWAALPFAARSEKAALSKKYGVSGIPCLILLNGKTGELINENGRKVVTQDPAGDKFGLDGWTHHYPQWSELLAVDEELVTKDGSKKTMKDLEGKYVAVYFSAHWCPPCRRFTPQLATWYKANAQKNNLEIVFCSGDRDKSSFEEYCGEQPWLAAQLKGTLSDKLNEAFEHRGIPHLVLVNPQGELVTADMRSGIPDGKFPFAPAAAGTLGEDVEISNINDTPAIVVYGKDASADDRQKAIDAMMPIGKEWMSMATRKSKLSPLKMAMMFGVETGQWTDQLKRLTKGSDDCVLAYVDLDGEKFVECKECSKVGDITTDMVRALIEKATA